MQAGSSPAEPPGKTLELEGVSVPCLSPGSGAGQPPLPSRVHSQASPPLPHPHTALSLRVYLGLIRALVIEIRAILMISSRASWWLSGKESTCRSSRCRRRGFDPWVGKVPWRRKWQPTPVFLPGEFHGQRSLADHSPRGCRIRSTIQHPCSEQRLLPVYSTSTVTETTASGACLCFDFHCELFSVPSLLLPVFLVLQAQDYST